MIFIIFRQDFILHWSISPASVWCYFRIMWKPSPFSAEKNEGNVSFSFFNRIAEIQANASKYGLGFENKLIYNKNLQVSYLY